MFYVGIDVAKDKHDCHILTSDGEVLVDNFSFDNSMEGFVAFLDLLKKHNNGIFDKTKVGLESTGHYSKNLLCFLKQNGLSVVVFNPLTVNSSKKALTLRRTKTDKNDARYLAELLIPNRSNTYSEPLYHISALKSLSRARFRLNKEIQPLKNRYRRLVHIVFPELGSLFSSLYIATVFALLKELPSAHHIAKCNITKLKNILQSNSRGRHARCKADELKALAGNSIGSSNVGDCIELKLTIDRILFLENQKAEYDKEINSLMQEINSPITSIPGIGNVLGAAIISEIGDINNFSSSAKLLAFAGCDPSTYQSGKFTATNTPMVKHGSRYLRNALYLATTMAFVHSKTFTDYIDKKRDQNKHYYVAISHGMKKMVRVIFAVLTQNSQFVEISSPDLSTSEIISSAAVI